MRKDENRRGRERESERKEGRKEQEKARKSKKERWRNLDRWTASFFCCCGSSLACTLMSSSALTTLRIRNSKLGMSPHMGTSQHLPAGTNLSLFLTNSVPDQTLLIVCHSHGARCLAFIPTFLIPAFVPTSVSGYWSPLSSWKGPLPKV